MLIDIVEPILDAIEMPVVSVSSKQFIKTLISRIKRMRISGIKSYSSLISLRDQVPRSSLLNNSSFIPEHIRDYIEKESKYYETHEYNYKGRQFNIIMVYDDVVVERKKGIEEDMFKWLSMIVDMGKLAENCAQTTTIYCYMTPFKKELPTSRGDILSYDNANSAVTTACSVSNEICIFRKEEMFKVFIHETFHAFNLDFSLQLTNTHVKQMKQMFNVKSDFNIYETYAETWAEIMNILFLSEEVSLANKMLQAEVAFSLHQLNKVLTYMRLDYSDIINNNSAHRYKEETNVFCYYVLKTIVLFYWSDFIEFCGGSFKYERKIDDFIRFIREKYQEDKFIRAVNMASTGKTSITMRMTLWEN